MTAHEKRRRYGSMGKSKCGISNLHLSAGTNSRSESKLPSTHSAQRAMNLNGPWLNYGRAILRSCWTRNIFPACNGKHLQAFLKRFWLKPPQTIEKAFLLKSAFTVGNLAEARVRVFVWRGCTLFFSAGTLRFSKSCVITGEYGAVKSQQYISK